MSSRYKPTGGGSPCSQASSRYRPTWLAASVSSGASVEVVEVQAPGAARPVPVEEPPLLRLRPARGKGITVVQVRPDRVAEEQFRRCSHEEPPYMGWRSALWRQIQDLAIGPDRMAGYMTAVVKGHCTAEDGVIVAFYNVRGPDGKKVADWRLDLHAIAHGVEAVPARDGGGNPGRFMAGGESSRGIRLYIDIKPAQVVFEGDPRTNPNY